VTKEKFEQLMNSLKQGYGSHQRRYLYYLEGDYVAEDYIKLMKTAMIGNLYKKKANIVGYVRGRYVH
jgi:hypothetical protein